MTAEIFNKWYDLFIVSFAFCSIVYTSYWLGFKKEVSFKKFTIIIYLFAILITFLFLFITTDGLMHFVKQVESINNGIFYSTKVLFNEHMSALEAFNKVKYIFGDLSANESGYTMPGTTHPPGNFLIAAIIGFIAVNISDNFALGWGIVVTFLNALLVPVVMIISKEIFSKKIGKLTGIMMITVPSLCMHFSAMFDVLFSLFVMTGVLFLVYGLKYVYVSKNLEFIKTSKVFFFGFLGGIFFTLAAQGTYGHAIPILSFLLSFLILVRKEWKVVLVFIIGITIPAIMYFIFEYFISSGKTFWPVRALNIVSIVGNDLILARPFPLAYFANFIIIFVIGGVVIFPIIIYLFIEGKVIIKNIYTHNFIVLDQKHLIRNFLVLSGIFMTLFLLFQTTVRLEVERTWHWYMASLWPLMGVLFIALEVTVKRLFPNQDSVRGGYGSLIFISLQMVITLVLSVSIMDYY